MGNNPSRFKGPKNPVEMVSWNECQQFIEKLNNSVRDRPGEFRLPTEAEWEYACRAGSTTCWCFGGEESRLGEYAWYRSNSGYTTHPVGGKKPNAWGLHDMHGNVWEWCADWKSDYTAKEVTDPTGPSEGAYRVLRGGGRSDFAGGCVSANRNGHAPVLTDDYVGLRVSLVPAGKQ
jgi:formylglycine-generating enzyme required for sulfatase activity